jgi:hypothetical protein
MKTFSTSGTGNQQTLSPIESNKIPIYDSLEDVEADLANLEEGQFVATPDTGDELAQPVDVVEEGNLHAVSSNAVAESLKTLIKTTTINIGNVTVSSNNYALISSNILQGHIILGINITYWESASGCFNVINYTNNSNGRNDIYLLANNGFSVQSLRIKIVYI